MKRGQALNVFYYLAPLWFLVEVFVWPDFRAGVVVGSGVWGKAAFYAFEGGLGAALWFQLPYAEAGALAENVAYLIFAFKFVLFGPLDIALSFANDDANAPAMAHHYSAAVPGIVYSAFHVVYKIKRAIGGGIV